MSYTCTDLVKKKHSFQDKKERERERGGGGERERERDQQMSEGEERKVQTDMGKFQPYPNALHPFK